MSVEHSCGEPEWFLKDHSVEQAIDPLKAEIEDLKNQVMRLTLQRQEQQLKALNEEYFRSQHPAVQDAWDKYQTVSKLASTK